jgi:hypothetical protein
MDADSRPIRSAAIVVTSLSPATSELILKELGNEESREIGMEISHLTAVSSQDRDTVLSEFLRLWAKPSSPPRQINPARMSGAGQDLSDDKGTPVPGSEEAKARTNLSAAQKIAILLVSLPSEASEKLLEEFGPKEKQSICRELSMLPSVPPEIVNRVIEDFDLAVHEVPAACREAPPASEKDRTGEEIRELISSFRVTEDDDLLPKFRRRIRIFKIGALIIPIIIALMVTLYFNMAGRKAGKFELLFIMATGALLMVILLFILLASQIAFLKNYNRMPVSPSGDSHKVDALLEITEKRAKEDPARAAELLRSAWIKKET